MNIPRGREIGVVASGKLEEEEARTRRPFVATLRVNNPGRQSLASSRKRVLRGGGEAISTPRANKAPRQSPP